MMFLPDVGPAQQQARVPIRVRLRLRWRMRVHAAHQRAVYLGGQRVRARGAQSATEGSPHALRSGGDRRQQIGADCDGRTVLPRERLGCGNERQTVASRQAEPRPRIQEVHDRQH